MCRLCQIRSLIDAAEAASAAVGATINGLADAFETLVDPETDEALEGKEAELYATLLNGAEELFKRRREHRQIMAALDGHEGVEVMSDEVLHDAPRHSVH